MVISGSPGPITYYFFFFTDRGSLLNNIGIARCLRALGGLMNWAGTSFFFVVLEATGVFFSTASGIQNGSVVGVRVMIFSDRLDMPFGW